MKKIVLITILSFLLLSFGIQISAQEADLPSPGLLPDSPFYFLERAAEWIGTFFTFGDLKKAERYATLAAERLAEAQAVVEKGKPELAEKTLERYRMQLQNSMARAEKAQAKGQNTEQVMIRVGKATSLHLEVLAEVYEKVSEEMKPAIENAMKASVKGHERAVEALKVQNALGDVPEAVSLPEEVPQEVRERIQIRVQQELEIEETLQGVDMSKSLRDICAEQGGPPEMCEQFPLEKFKSFKEIEDYCLGLGGQADICSTLEQKCREFGITDAHECFILLSVSSVKAYQSATIESHTGTPLSEEEMEERRRREEENIEIRHQNAYLGVMFSAINDDMQAERGLPVNYGALLISIVPGSPAALAGLKERDIILEFHGEKITENNNLTEVISRSGVGVAVTLKVLRGEEIIITNVELVEGPPN